jgi:hypothetical protein
VSAGRPYIVGERAPELFIPSQSGSIVPKIRGGGDFKMTIINQAPVQIERQRDSQGNPMLIIREAVKSVIGGGFADKEFRGRYGMNPSTARR